MNNNIFIPKRINVGFQNRSDTYTKKLAYVIYFDEKDKLRKEASWQSWRDEKIPNEEYNNIPTQGFVLNKKVGDYCSDWNHRQAYVRVYDPRNFEFEITIENLLYILENTSSIKGKGLEGEFIYGWDKKDLILIPVSSPDYQEFEKYSNILQNNETIKVKDLIIGATYKTKENEEWIYMGKHTCYDYQYKALDNGEYKWFKKYSDLPTESCKTYWGIGSRHVDYEYTQTDCGQRFFFLRKYKNWNNEIVEEFKNIKSLSKKFITTVDNNCIHNYAELFERMEHYEYYSPIDDSKDVTIPYSFDEFNNEFTENQRSWWYRYYYNIDGEKFEIRKTDDNKYKVKNTLHSNIEELFNYIQPVHVDKYLENGKLYKRSY